VLKNPTKGNKFSHFSKADFLISGLESKLKKKREREKG
jgi:hypothetical protein